MSFNHKDQAKGKIKKVWESTENKIEWTGKKSLNHNMFDEGVLLEIKREMFENFKNIFLTHGIYQIFRSHFLVLKLII